MKKKKSILFYGILRSKVWCFYMKEGTCSHTWALSGPLKSKYSMLQYFCLTSSNIASILMLNLLMVSFWCHIWTNKECIEGQSWKYIFVDSRNTWTKNGTRGVAAVRRDLTKDRNSWLGGEQLMQREPACDIPRPPRITPLLRQPDVSAGRQVEAPAWAACKLWCGN